MFETLQMAPPDPILGLSEAFKKDPHPHKINLSVGVYQDAQGQTPILEVVKEAEQRLLAEETNKGYLGIDGLPEYGRHVREMLFGADHEIVLAAPRGDCPDAGRDRRAAGGGRFHPAETQGPPYLDQQPHLGQPWQRV